MAQYVWNPVTYRMERARPPAVEDHDGTSPWLTLAVAVVLCLLIWAGVIGSVVWAFDGMADFLIEAVKEG